MNRSRTSVYRILMRTLFTLFLLVHMHGVRAQRLDPDQNPYWTRYTFVEDSNALVPLKGDYRVYYTQDGWWWNNMPLGYPVEPRPDEEVRLQPLFGQGYPTFRATPARGKDLPDVKVVVVRDRDTMVVELSVSYRARGGEVNERCKTMTCERRPPMVIPFRAGRYLPVGQPFTKEYYSEADSEDRVDARTISLTGKFDVLWDRASREGRIVPQLNTDTCRQELSVPANLDRPETSMRDTWLMRSPYCGTHLVLFPSMGTVTDYTVTFVPYHPEQKKDPVHVHVPLGDHTDGLVDVSAWPVGDHHMRLISSTNSGTFTLKLR